MENKRGEGEGMTRDGYRRQVRGAGAKMAPPTQLSIRDEEKFCTLHTNRSANTKFSFRPENFSFFLSVHSHSAGDFRSAVVSVVGKLIFVFFLQIATFRNMKYLYIIVPAILAVILSISSKKAAAQPVCSSAYLDNPQNRKLCATLANFFGLPNSLEAYSDEIRPNFGYGLPLGYKGRLPPSDFIENMPGTKRQDVDHVFLRFGRRR